MSGPLVSVIVAVYNGERFLRDALISVLEQDYRPLEIIVIDDGSTDSTPLIAAEFDQVRYVRQGRQGVGGAWNRGLTVAVGQYIGFLDHDDLFLPGKLTRQVRFLEENPQVGVVIAHLENFFEEGDERPSERTAEHLPGVFAFVAPDSSLVRRSVFERIGPYELKPDVCSDLEWLARALRQGVRLEIIPDVLLRRRLHSSNNSNPFLAKRRYMLGTLKFLLDQSRRSAGAAQS